MPSSRTGLKVCSVKGCTINDRNDQSIKFFRFPHNMKRYLKWLAFSQNTHLMERLAKNSHKNRVPPLGWICYKHFPAERFTSADRNRLLYNTIPSLYPPPRDNSFISDHLYSLPNLEEVPLNEISSDILKESHLSPSLQPVSPPPSSSESNQLVEEMVQNQSPVESPTLPSPCISPLPLQIVQKGARSDVAEPDFQLIPFSSTTSHPTQLSKERNQEIAINNPQEIITSLMNRRDSLIKENEILKKENIDLKLKIDSLSEEISRWKSCAEAITKKAKANSYQDHLDHTEEINNLRSVLSGAFEKMKYLRNENQQLKSKLLSFNSNPD